jgi:hypothetical protein
MISLFFGIILSLALAAHALVSMKNPSDFLFVLILFSFLIPAILIIGSVIETYQCRLCICSEWFEAYEESSNKRVKVPWRTELSVSIDDIITDKFVLVNIEKSKQKLKIKVPIKNSIVLSKKIECYGGPDHFLLHGIRNSCS